MPCMLTRVCQYHERSMICAKTPVVAAAAAAVVCFHPNVFKSTIRRPSRAHMRVQRQLGCEVLGLHP